jgi:hypothetical protein
LEVDLQITSYVKKKKKLKKRMKKRIKNFWKYPIPGKYFTPSFFIKITKLILSVEGV